LDNLAVIDVSSDNSASVVDHVKEMKSGIIQIKNIHFSTTINKVQGTNILLKLQSGQTISISASIRDILVNDCNRLIENNNLYVDDKVNLDSNGQYIVPYGKANGGCWSKVKLLRGNCKSVAKWIDIKFDPFVYLALNLTPQNNRPRKSM